MTRTVLVLLCCAAGAFPASRPVTFHQDVLPVLARHCQTCHQPGEIAPMQFVTYEQTRPWARAIREAVLKGTMPPWHADRETSHRFQNNRLLPEADRDVLAAWATDGAKEGTPVPPPAAPAVAAQGWRLGKPDLVVKIPAFPVPAIGTVAYTFLVTPTRFAEDKWIAAAEWKIDQRTVVHHMNAFLRPPGSSYVKEAPVGQMYVASKEERGARRTDEREVDRRELLIGYEPGYVPQPWGEGKAKLLRKGTDIVFEVHYTANGKAVSDSSELGLYFTSQPPEQRVITLAPADSQLVIPPGASEYRSFVTATFTKPVKLVSLQPHMHLRGKAYEFAAVYPDGRREALLRVPRYDFNWQTTYALARPLLLPAGTRLECTAWFDNSANNRFNPDPAVEVRWGDQSWEEMNVGFTEVAFDARQDPDVAVLSGTTRPGTASR